ncbi:MAG: substrate-binding domain-containing protein [Chloroflexi bacterium]|nr:substrate-binding domain-containing protein [Chloroflexota bacterium]
MHRSGRALAAVVAVLVAACGGAASPAPPGSPGGTSTPLDPTAPLFSAVYASADRGPATEAAAFTATIDELGGRSAVGDARRDPRIAVRLVEEAIAAGARGISVTAPDGSTGPALARLASSAGVPLVATQARIVDDAGRPVPFVGIDDRDLGATVGAAAAALVAESRWKGTEVGVLSVEVQTLASCAARAEGQRAALQDAGIPPANFVAVPFSGEVRSAEDAALPLITAGPQVARWVVVGCTDQGVQGGLNALATAGFTTADVIGVGLGADLACRAWAHDEETGFRAALFVYGGDVGATAARILWDAAQDRDPLPAETIVHGTIVTPDSYEDLVPASFAAACAGPASP